MYRLICKTAQEKRMNASRRSALKTTGGASVLGLAAAAGLFAPGSVFASDWNKNAFEAKSLNDVVKAMGGMSAAESKDIVFVTAPDIAENGAVVPIAIQSKIAKTEAVAILVEKNPNALAASFEFPAGTEAFASTRVKMGQSSNVHAVVKADGKYFYATKEVKVTRGGCGG
jgi:sulfur-oxidizing protein SoxY